MKIIFVTLGFSPLRMSGFDISGERVVSLLLNQGRHSVTVIAAGNKDTVEDILHPNLRVIRLPLGKTNWIGYAPRAAMIVNQIRDASTVVHFWEVSFAYAYSGQFIASLQHSFRQRLVSLRYQQQGGLLKRAIYYIYYQAAMQLAEIPALNKADALVAMSTTIKDHYCQEYKVPTEKISIAHHPIDACSFRPVKTTNYLKSRLGIPKDAPVIFFAAFVTPRKGLEYLIQALQKMKHKPYLVIAGRWQNEAYRNYILSLAGPVEEQIIQVGFVSDESMPEFYSMADVYVSPSLLEGFGLPLAESLACETPVVAADSGSVKEVVGPGGLLVPPGNSDELASAIDRLLDDAKLRRKLGRDGKDYVRQTFNADRLLRILEEVYRGVSATCERPS